MDARRRGIAAMIGRRQVGTEHNAHPDTQLAPSPVFAMITGHPDRHMVEQLATVLQSEAGGEHEEAMIRVGWTILERMRRNHATSVDQVWCGYAHKAKPTEEAYRIATGILDGSIPEPPGHATHFYSPQLMPEFGHPVDKFDISGGLETIDGKTRYRPGFAGSGPKHFIEVPTPDIERKKFRFFHAPGDGPVR